MAQFDRPYIWSVVATSIKVICNVTVRQNTYIRLPIQLIFFKVLVYLVSFSGQSELYFEHPRWRGVNTTGISS